MAGLEAERFLAAVHIDATSGHSAHHGPPRLDVAWALQLRESQQKQQRLAEAVANGAGR